MKYQNPSIKDIIDWKVFNYLIDKCTKYGDEGYSVHITACLKHGNGLIESMYSANYMADGTEHITRKEIIEAPLKPNYLRRYNDSGVFYKVWIRYNSGGWPKWFAHKFYEEVKHKFDKFDITDMSELIIKPKAI